MSLLDDLNNTEALTSKFNQRCGMCSLLDDLSEAERAKVNELLQNPKIGKSQLSKVLTKNGHEIKSGVLTRHARGECAG